MKLKDVVRSFGKLPLEAVAIAQDRTGSIYAYRDRFLALKYPNDLEASWYCPANGNSIVTILKRDAPLTEDWSTSVIFVEDGYLVNENPAKSVAPPTMEEVTKAFEDLLLATYSYTQNSDAAALDAAIAKADAVYLKLKKGEVNE